ncbi:hypothetical protein Hanom_Chr17g01574821 [Helianthus anomalus]
MPTCKKLKTHYTCDEQLIILKARQSSVSPFNICNLHKKKKGIENFQISIK